MKLLFLDIETTGLDWKSDSIHGIGYAYEEDEVSYTDLYNLTPNSTLLSDLADPSIPKIGCNVRFDLRFLKRAGLEVAGPIWDIKILAQLLDENSPLGLKELTARYLGEGNLDEKSDIDRAVSLAGVKHVGDLCRLDISKPGLYYDLIARYCCEDVNNTLKLFHMFVDLVKDMDRRWKEERGVSKGPLDYLKEEAFPVEEALFHMETRGIKIDPKAIADTQKLLKAEHERLLFDLNFTYQKQIVQVEEGLYEKALEKRKTEKGKSKVLRSSDSYSTKFMWSSSQHVGKLIYETFEVPPKLVSKTKSGLYSTGDFELSALKEALPPTHPLQDFLSLFNKYRASAKLLSTYASPDSGLLQEISDGRIYSLYLQAGSSKEGGVGGTATGRLSSQSPNMQNLPRAGGIKKFFVPDSEDKVFAYFDYSQVELRIAAHLSQDKELVNAYTKGLDLHSLTASGIFGKTVDRVSKEERQAAKTINFAMIYDAKAYRLWQELGPLGYSLDDCEQMRKAFFEKYSGYKAFLKRVLKYVQEYGCVISETGRVRRLPDIEYGDALNWQTRTVDCSKELYERLRAFPQERLSPAEAFIRAKKKFNHATKQAYNFPIQGLGASITKRAMIELNGAGYDLITQVHDSIVIQLHKENSIDCLAEIRHTMERSYRLTVPLVAEGKLIKSLDESDKAVSLVPTKEGVPSEDPRENPRDQTVSKSGKGRV